MDLSFTPRFMIVSDLDHTMVDHHDTKNKSLLRFNALWAANYYHDSLLVFSTGRSPTLYKELRSQKPMLTPNIAIMSVGTEIMYGDTMTPDEGWEQELNQGWDRAIVVEEASKFPQLRPQVETEQRPHKISFYVDKNQAQEIISALTNKFQERGLKVKLIYSGGIDLDILPEGAGKGQALAYLHRKFKAEGRLPANTLVCGDSGNDAELFAVPDVHGVMVGNAQEELLAWYEKNGQNNPRIFRATETCAAGIIQAMQHFKFQPSISPRDKANVLEEEEYLDPRSKVGNFIVNFYILVERWLRAEVENPKDVLKYLEGTLASVCTVIFPWGEEGSGHDVIESLNSKYGVCKESEYLTWVDRVRIRSTGEGNWLVRFDYWTRNGKEVTCRLITAVLETQLNTNKLLWAHAHETWLKGYSGSK